jgi:hypothetical protein
MLFRRYWPVVVEATFYGAVDGEGVVCFLATRKRLFHPGDAGFGYTTGQGRDKIYHGDIGPLLLDVLLRRLDEIIGRACEYRESHSGS